ncbi:hypothetical protein [Streptomyces sp. TRM49041]|uniref:hypothetical protein n=1 Tax=Streptomyces sp. TRM49041 TaxID=2603216 RepID=UPI00165687F6|nr:hypothetical protein [Streptomyces sp. TRM49041]
MPWAGLPGSDSTGYCLVSQRLWLDVLASREPDTPDAVKEDLPYNRRGLFLVDALSSGWGAGASHGHIVWAALPTWLESTADVQ